MTLDLDAAIWANQLARWDADPSEDDVLDPEDRDGTAVDDDDPIEPDPAADADAGMLPE